MLCNWVGEHILLPLVGPKLDKGGSGKNREARSQWPSPDHSEMIATGVVGPSSISVSLWPSYFPFCSVSQSQNPWLAYWFCYL